MKYAAFIARLFYSTIFILAAFTHFAPQTIAYAAAQGVPFAGFAVPFSGIMAAVGGISIALGYRARIGGILLALFLIPVTIALHNFWAVTDPMMAQMQMAMFMKNLALLGGAIYFAVNGAGAYTLDEYLKNRRNSHTGRIAVA